MTTLTPRLETRAQTDLKRAVSLIGAFAGREQDAAVRDNFTRRAKDFPALVMTVGLAQALAFSQEKARKSTPLAKAHQELLNQVAAILEVPEALSAVQDANALAYMHMTRRVLNAWTYHRRLALSILGEPTGNDHEN